MITRTTWPGHQRATSRPSAGRGARPLDDHALPRAVDPSPSRRVRHATINARRTSSCDCRARSTSTRRPSVTAWLGRQRREHRAAMRSHRRWAAGTAHARRVVVPRDERARNRQHHRAGRPTGAAARAPTSRSNEPDRRPPSPVVVSNAPSAQPFARGLVGRPPAVRSRSPTGEDLA